MNCEKEKNKDEKQKEIKFGKEQEKIIEDNKIEKIKDISEEDLPDELIEIIENRKNKEPFTEKDFKKYNEFKNLNINFSK